MRTLKNDFVTKPSDKNVMKCNLCNKVDVGPGSNQSDLQNDVIVMVNWDISLHTGQVAQLHQTRAYPCFCRMKRLGMGCMGC